MKKSLLSLMGAGIIGASSLLCPVNSRADECDNLGIGSSTLNMFGLSFRNIINSSRKMSAKQKINSLNFAHFLDQQAASKSRLEAECAEKKRREISRTQTREVNIPENVIKVGNKYGPAPGYRWLNSEEGDFRVVKKENPPRREENQTLSSGLFTYSRWIDINENGVVERNELFGKDKKSFDLSKDEFNISFKIKDKYNLTDFDLKIINEEGKIIWEKGIIRLNGKLETGVYTLEFIPGKNTTLGDVQSNLKVSGPGKYSLFLIGIKGEDKKEILGFMNLELKDSKRSSLLKLLRKEPKGLWVYKDYYDKNNNGIREKNEFEGLVSKVFSDRRACFDYSYFDRNAEEQEEMKFKLLDSKNKVIAWNRAYLRTGESVTALIHQFRSEGKEMLIEDAIKNLPNGKYKLIAEREDKKVGEIKIVLKDEKKFPPPFTGILTYTRKKDNPECFSPTERYEGLNKRVIDLSKEDLYVELRDPNGDSPTTSILAYDSNNKPVNIDLPNFPEDGVLKDSVRRGVFPEERGNYLEEMRKNGPGTYRIRFEPWKKKPSEIKITLK